MLTLSLAGLFVAGLASPLAQAEDPKPCAASSFKVKQVEQACRAGGQLAAKKLMKRAVNKAKEAGETMNCKTCHTSLKTFELTGADTVGQLKKWL